MQIKYKWISKQLLQKHKILHTFCAHHGGHSPSLSWMPYLATTPHQNAICLPRKPTIEALLYPPLPWYWYHVTPTPKEINLPFDVNDSGLVAFTPYVISVMEHQLPTEISLYSGPLTRPPTVVDTSKRSMDGNTPQFSQSKGLGISSLFVLLIAFMWQHITIELCPQSSARGPWLELFTFSLSVTDSTWHRRPTKIPSLFGNQTRVPFAPFRCWHLAPHFLLQCPTLFCDRDFSTYYLLIPSHWGHLRSEWYNPATAATGGRRTLVIRFRAI